MPEMRRHLVHGVPMLHKLRLLCHARRLPFLNRKRASTEAQAQWLNLGNSSDAERHAMTLCPICGWGDQIQQHCTSVMQAVLCDLNKANWRKYTLRYPGQIARGELPTPTLVRAARNHDLGHKDGPGRGNAREELVPITIEAAKAMLEPRWERGADGREVP